MMVLSSSTSFSVEKFLGVDVVPSSLVSIRSFWLIGFNDHPICCFQPNIALGRSMSSKAKKFFGEACRRPLVTKVEGPESRSKARTRAASKVESRESKVESQNGSPQAVEGRKRTTKRQRTPHPGPLPKERVAECGQAMTIVG